MVQSKKVEGGDLRGDPGGTQVQLVTHQVEGGYRGGPPRGTWVHIPGSNEVGVPESKGHVTPHFEGPDLGCPPRGYPGPHTRVQRSWDARVQRSCDPLIRWAGLRESIGGIPESKISSPKKLPYPSPKIELPPKFKGLDFGNHMTLGFVQPNFLGPGYTLGGPLRSGPST